MRHMEPVLYPERLSRARARREPVLKNLAGALLVLEEAPAVVEEVPMELVVVAGVRDPAQDRHVKYAAVLHRLRAGIPAPVLRVVPLFLAVEALDCVLHVLRLLGA
ncbi:hypothetical protein LZ554_008774 [Drepanopeziza brunnea f. sp. 'monogermtubi']|nr:hypothetical protein LZ554_008774 [Drepanopeziza brunnea f. sp. 'monogermtubi']